MRNPSKYNSEKAPSGIFLDNRDTSASVLGIWAVLFTVISQGNCIVLPVCTVITPGITKHVSSLSVASSMWQFFQFFYYLTAGCICIGIGRPFSCNSLASGFNSIFTSRPISTLFSWNNFPFFSNLQYTKFLNTLNLKVSVFNLIPRCFMQSSPRYGFDLFVYVNSSSFFFSPTASRLAIILPPNLILWLFTLMYSAWSGCIGVRWCFL